jgi:alkanesulfonate monooxygenase SsuD/methylene tetrahydromethanopterin reductase-like flavin-dependent oxidoreductase (luciferase family)
MQLIRGNGVLEETLACFQMLTKLLELPYRRDAVDKILRDKMRRGQKPDLQLCGQIAAMLGLPYACASHFAPQGLLDAVRIYRERFVPSEQLAVPHVIAGVNVVVAETEEAALAARETRRRGLARVLFGRGGEPLDDHSIEAVLAGPQGRHVDDMLTYTALGTPEIVRAYLRDFRRHANADELMLVHHSDSVEGRLNSLDLLGEADSVVS